MKSTGPKKTMLKIHPNVNPKTPADLSKALLSSPKALTTWKDITPFARRDWILWIITAKQLETRKRRIKNACEMLAHGKRRVCCFGGIKWLMKMAQENK